MVQNTNLTDCIRQGKKEALFTLMSVYYNDLFRYGMKFTADKDLTKEIISQFFLQVWDHRERFGAATNLQAYLLVSFRHYLVGYLSKISRQLDIYQDADAGIECSYEDYLIAWQEEEQLRQSLQKAIESLPNRQKELVRLRYYERMSIDQIAQHTGLVARTIYNKLHEAIGALRGQLKAPKISSKK